MKHSLELVSPWVRKCILLTGIALILAGCAAKISEQSHSALPTTRPVVVYVGRFDLGSELLSQATTQPAHHGPLHFLHHDDDPAERAAVAERTLATDLIGDLRQAGVQAMPLESTDSAPTEGWLVKGDFLVLNPGNRVERAAIGFGAGASEAKLYVTMSDLSHPNGESLLNFNADSNRPQTPGGTIAMVAAHSPWGMVAKFALDKDATGKDLKQVAAAISDQIVKFASQGKPTGQ